NAREEAKTWVNQQGFLTSADVNIMQGSASMLNTGTNDVGVTWGTKTLVDFFAKKSHTHTWGQITGKPTTFAPSAHTHSANDINSGTLNIARIPDSFVTKNNIGSSALATTVIDFDATGNGASILYAGYASTNRPSVSGTAGGLLIRGNHSTVGEYQLYLARGENDALLYRNQSGVWNRAASREWTDGRFALRTRTITAGNGLSGGGTLAGNRTITLGTPGAITLSSTNSVGTSSHTHAFNPGGTTAQYIRGDGSLATYANTTYSAGTLALLNIGTNTTNRVWSAKILTDFTDGKYLQLSGGDLTKNSSPYAQAFNSHLNLKQSDQVDGTFVGISYSSSRSNNYGWSAGAIRRSGGNSDFVFKNHFNSIEGIERVKISGSGTVTAPTFNGALTGNATTATRLATSRTIWGRSFNGGGNVSGALSGATTGNFSSTLSANRIVVTSTSNVKHLEFSRSDYNYITSKGHLGIITGGTGTGFSNQQVWIHSNGNTKIGAGNSSVPAYTLDVNGTGRFTGTVIIPDGTAGNHAASMHNVATEGNSVESWVNQQGFLKAADVNIAQGSLSMLNAGTSEVGVTWGAKTLSDWLNGKANATGTVSNSLVRRDGLKINASGGFFETSDRRLKTSIKDMGDTLNKVLNVPTVSYNMNKQDSIGTIAQDVQEIFPELVNTDEDGILSVNYAKLSIVAIKAIKELKEELNEVKRTINE